MSEAPKYSRLEIERRWLVDLSAVDLASASFREIEDLYVDDTRLRLRKVSGSNGVVYKLGKKYGRTTSLSEPITNLYLTEGGIRHLADLPGRRTRKRRYSLSRGSVDVYLEPITDVAVFEVEFDDEKSAKEYEPPPFVTREVTNETAYSGASLAKWFNG